MGKEYNQKRINPPFWQHDYHVLKQLYDTLGKITKTLNYNHPLSILDYGCGTSPYQNIFMPLSSKYIRVDIDESVNADYIVKEGEKIPLGGGSYDLILSTQVLEHIKNTSFYLEECARLLKKNGLLILTTHGLWPYHPYPSDFNRWTRIGLEETIKNHGFKIEKSFSILGPFASVIQFELLIIAERLMRLEIFGKIFLATLSIFGNALIWFEDKIAPPTDVSDSSVYVICAKKI